MTSFRLPVTNPTWIYEGLDQSLMEEATGLVFNRAPKQIQRNVEALANYISKSSDAGEYFEVSQSNSPYDAVSNTGLNLNLDSNLIVRLPASPKRGDKIRIRMVDGDASQYNVTILGNGKTIDSAASVYISTWFFDYTYAYTGSQWTNTSVAAGTKEGVFINLFKSMVGNIIKRTPEDTLDDMHLPLSGGLYNRADYPDLWGKVQSEAIPDSEWLTTQQNSVGGAVMAYSTGDGSTTFRVPSVGTSGVFFRSVTSDGSSLSGLADLTKAYEDSFKSHSHTGNTDSFDYGTKTTTYITMNGRFNTNTTGAHTHYGSTSSAGYHNHSGNTSITGGHRHSWTSRMSANSGQGSADSRANSGGSAHTVYTNSEGSHNHSLNINSNGNHSHSFSTSSEGSHYHYVDVNFGNHSHNVTIGSHSHSFTTSGTGGTETRPKMVFTKDAVFAGVKGGL